MLNKENETAAFQIYQPLGRMNAEQHHVSESVLTEAGVLPVSRPMKLQIIEQVAAATLVFLPLFLSVVYVIYDISTSSPGISLDNPTCLDDSARGNLTLIPYWLEVLTVLCLSVWAISWFGIAIPVAIRARFLNRQM